MDIFKDGRMVRSTLLLTLLLLVGAGASRAASYYVAVAGSDSNPGTSASPFLTVQKGVDAAAAGDTIIVGNGTYLYTGGSGGYHVAINTAGTASAWITLRAQNPGQAFLNGNGNLGGYGISFGGSSAYWVIKGFDISGYYWAAFHSNSLGGHYIKILGNVIHNIGNQVNTSSYGEGGIYTDVGASNWTIDGNIFHDIGRTSGLPNANHDHAIYIHATNTVISNNVFYNALYGWHVQVVSGFTGTIANNIFFGPAGINQPGEVGSIVLDGESGPIGSLALENNTFYNPLSVGIFTYLASVSGPCSIDHNVLYNASSSLGLIDSMPAGCVQSSNLLNINPELTAPSLPNYDFHLLSGSPAIGAGVVLSAVPLDFDGVSRAARDDIGAYQYAGAASTTTAPSPPPSCVVSANTWQNVALAAQTGSFTAEFDAVAGLANMDGVSGLSNGASSAYAALAAAVRFNNAGMIDARNGDVYAANASIPYVAGMSYHFRFVVNMTARTYSAYVRQGSGAEQLIGGNYGFRTEQNNVTALNNQGVYAGAGSLTACNAAVTASVTTAAPGEQAKAPQKFLSLTRSATFGASAAEVSIYNLRGRLVFHGSSQGGVPIIWNCRDGMGRVDESGVYIAKIRTTNSGVLYQSFALAK